VSELAPALTVGRRPAGAAWRTAALQLLVAAIVLWLAFVLIGRQLGGRWSHGALVRWDASVDRRLAADRAHPWNVATHLATFGAETITVLGIGLVAFVLLRLRLHRWREPVFLAVTVIGEVTMFVCITLLVDRARPPVRHLDSAPPTSSFPSGHTAASVALYGGLAVLAWRTAAATWLRTIATVLALVLPLAVAASRLYRGMHYPSDVLAGVLLACCWLMVTSRVVLGRRSDP